MRKLLSLAFLAFPVLPLQAWSQAGTVFNQTLVASPGGSTQFYEIASFPANSSASYDHIHILMTVNMGDNSNENTAVDAMFANHGGFRGLYSVRGAPFTNGVSIQAYRHSSDQTVDLYIAFASNESATASYSIVENQQETAYQNAIPCGAAACTNGSSDSLTQVFLTADQVNYPPISFQDFSGNLYLGGSLGPISGSAPFQMSNALQLNNGQLLLNSQNQSKIVADAYNIFMSPNLSGSVVVAPYGATGTSISSRDGSIHLAVPTGATGSNAGAIVFPDGSFLNSASQLSTNGGTSGSVTASSVTAGSIPVFTGTSALTSSVMTQTSSNIGIGTNVPQNVLSTIGGINIDQNDSDDGTNMFPSYLTTYGITFGDSSGEGISSARTEGAPNRYGLDFYTGFKKNMVITNQGNVGIGTSSPAATLDVNGNVRIASLGVSNASTICTDANGILTTSGCSSVQSNLTVRGSQTGLIVSATNLGNGTYPLTSLQNSGNLLLGWNQLAGRGEQDFIANEAAGSPGGYVFWDYSNSGTISPLLSIDSAGNVGIGTTSTAPNTKLQVVGNVLLSGTGSSVTYPDGTVQATAWNGTTLGGDYAEAVDVQGDRAKYEPGDVIVIDATSIGRFAKSSSAYSKLVAGVYSTKPGLVGRRTTAERPDKDAEVPMAMMGIVPTKVCDENGPIEVGDLLVSSNTPGYAMKATDVSRRSGATIGKALAPLKSGSGVIEVLVTLQ